MIVERLLPFKAELSARMESLMQHQSPRVRSEFGLTGIDTSWFNRIRAR